MQGLFILLTYLITAAKWIIIAQAVLSWLVQFQVLNLRQPLVWQVWSGLNRILEPVYAPIRRILPPMAGVDFTPMALLIGILVLENLLYRNLALFY